LKWIIHDWEEAKAIAILQNVRKAMKAGAKLMLIEMIVKDGPEPDFAKWMDINMLVIPGGQERTVEEYRDLLGKAGFKLEKAIPTDGMPTLLLAGVA
jgi:O-methyltransferase domain